MSRLSKLDQVLLAEAYSAQLLEESIADMSIEEIQARLPYMTTEETILVEGFLKNMGQRIGQMSAGLGNVGSAAAKGIGGAASGAFNKAKQVGAGTLAAGKQIASNVKELNDVGAIERESQNNILNAAELMNQVINLVSKAQQQKLIKSQKPITDMSLSEIMDELKTAQQSAQKFKQNANKAGFTGGIGKAYQQGAQSVKPSQPMGMGTRQTA
jgi:hypothetical protein